VDAGTASTAPGGREVLDVDLVDLANVIGLRVRVGGVVVGTVADGFVLDDGTALATVHLEGDALQAGDVLAMGLALNLVATVVDGAEPSLSVASADDVVTLGDLGAPPVVASPSDSGPDVAGLLLPDGTPGATVPGDSTLAGETAPGGGTGLVIGLLLSLALVGVVALALGRRRPATRMMARPDRPRET
jgi:hypothetical protein